MSVRNNVAGVGYCQAAISISLSAHASHTNPVRFRALDRRPHAFSPPRFRIRPRPVTGYFSPVRPPRARLGAGGFGEVFAKRRAGVKSGGWIE